MTTYSNPADKRPYASFTPDGGSILIMPFEEAEKESGGRDHIHVFPHSPGGLPEKLGAELKSFTLRCFFDPAFEGIYPSSYAYPDTLDALEDAADSQVTGTLVLPTMKTPVRAYCRKVHRTQTAKVTSGERATISFMQDQTVEEKFAQTNIQSSANNLVADANTFAAITTDFDSTLPGTMMGLVGSLVALDGTSQQFSFLAASLVDQIADVADQFLLTPVLDDPAYWIIVTACHDVLYDAILLGRNIQQNSAPILLYIVPTEMTTQEISIAIYGDSTHADDIFDENEIDDALSVPAMTKIQYLADEAS